MTLLKPIDIYQAFAGTLSDHVSVMYSKNGRHTWQFFDTMEDNIYSVHVQANAKVRDGWVIQAIDTSRECRFNQ